MPRFQRRNIQLYVWLFSLLLLIVPLCIGGWVVVRLDSIEFQESLRAALAAPLPNPLTQELHTQPVAEVLQTIQIPLVVLLLLLLSGHILVVSLFFRFLVAPMQRMVVQGQQIAEGNLENTQPAQGCAEVHALGQCFNDISSTLQELILLSWNHLRDSSALLAQVKQNELLQGTEQNPMQLRQNLAAIENEMRKLEQVITSFSLYDVQIRDKRAMAGEQTEQDSASQMSARTIATDGHQTRSLQ